MTRKRHDLMLFGCVLFAVVALVPSVTFTAGKPTRRTVVIPAKTSLDIRLASSLGSEGEGREQPVLASLAAPVIVDGVNVAPAASVLLGNVIAATESAPTAEISLRFDRLRVGPTTYDIRTTAVHLPSGGPPRADDTVRISSGTRFRLELLEPVSIEVQRLR
jgi:hypothetical protein